MNNDKKTINIIYIFNISLCLFLLTYGLVCGISGNDFFWHVKTGEWIFNNKQIPTTDVFSWYASANNYTWYAHEWLSDVIYFLIYKFIGIKGITVFSLLTLSINHLLIMKLTENKWKNHSNVAFLWFFYHIAISSLILQCRPFIFSFIFLNLELYLLYRFKEEENFKGIYFVPLIAILWCNMHGGSSNLSYLLLILFLIIGIIPSFIYKRIENVKFNNEKIKKLSIITIITILANCINPYGIKMLYYPYKYMIEGSFDMQVIMEWQALDLKTTLGIMLAISLILLSVFMLISQKNIKLINFLLFGAFAYLMLKSIRFEFMFFVIASYIIFDYVPEEINNIVKNKFLHIFSYVTIGIILVFCSTIFIIGNNFSYVEKTISDDVIEIIKKSDNKTLYNHYDFGGELIYNDISVFVDSRADVYSGNGNTLQEAWAIAELNNEFIDYNKTIDIDYYFNEKYKFDSVLIPKYVGLNIYLENRDDFKKIYENETIIYWERIN